MAHQNGLSTTPEVVAELGPGESIGTGLAALLCGAKRYYALDIVKYANREKNISILDELTDLFMRREAIPNADEFPEVKPYLASYGFPHHILTRDRLNVVLSKDRVRAIRDAVLGVHEVGENAVQVSYFAPWSDPEVVRERSVDMIVSQAVLEHVDDLGRTYQVIHHWLKPGGFLSEQVDFKCHGMATHWNGHWTYSDLVWKLIRGNRSYLLNRQPHSTHAALLRGLNFEIVCDVQFRDTSGIDRRVLAPRFVSMSDDDLTTTGAFIQAVRKAH